MSKRQLLCLLGVWIMIFLFLGFKSSWDQVIAVVTGLVIVVIAYNLPADSVRRYDEKRSFVDNTHI